MNNNTRSREDTRDMICRLIAGKPGINTEDVASGVGVLVDCARKHLRHLVNANKLTRTRNSKTNICSYYIAGCLPPERESKTTIEVIAEHPGIKAGELAKLLKDRARQVRFRLRYYLRHGQIVSSDGRANSESMFWVVGKEPSDIGAECDEFADQPMVRRIVKATDAQPIRTRAVRSVFELANV